MGNLQTMTLENTHNSGQNALNNLRGIVVFDPKLFAEATKLAREYGLEFIERRELFEQKSKLRLKFFKQLLEARPKCQFAMLLEGEGLQLIDLSSGVSILVDFCHGKANHRRIYGGGAGQMIAKAVGIKGSLRPRVLDATAGLGQDSFVLASLGCQVQMLERSNVVQCLLRDGLQRAQLEALDNPDLADVINRMSLSNGDSRSFLRDQLKGELEDNQENKQDLSVDASRPHVVYLDPMFPERKKSAQVKKEMQSFHQIVGSDLDANELLQPALDLALARVVVKRPRIAPYLAEREPDHQIVGKSSRYDIYINRALEKC